MTQILSPSTENIGAATSSAFSRVPLNPYTERVQTELNNLQQNVQPEVPSPVTAPPPPNVAPPSHQYAQPQSIPVQQPQVQPVYSPAQTPQYTPQIDPRILTAMQQAQIENQRLAEENNQAQQTIQNLLSKQDELDALKQRIAMQDAMGKDAFAELETVDPADAKRITDAILNATTPTMTAMHQELAKTRQLLVDSQQQMQSQVQRAQVQQVNQRILQAHSDFFQLQHTPEYHAFMNQRDGLSSQTRDQRAAQEFENGNAEYVIDLLNQLKGTIPSTAQITTVAPVQTATAVSPNASVPQTPPLTLRDLNNLFGMRQISPDEYRVRLKELRAAQQV